MNWYKKAQQKILDRYPNYTDIGHYDEMEIDGEDYVCYLWLSDPTGRNFRKKEIEGPSDYEDHYGWTYDLGVSDQNIYQGRYDSRDNIVSIAHPGFTTSFIPNRLIERLKREFGNNIKMLDYSSKVKFVV